MIEVAILVAILTGGAIAIRKLASGGNEHEGDEVWRNAARRVGGEVEVTARGLTRPAERTIRLTVEGVPMVVRSYRVASGNTHSTYTRVSAGPLPEAKAARIHCSKRNFARMVSKRLGIDELPTGHTAFDRDVHVSGSPESLVRTYLDGPTRLLVADSDTSFDVEGALLVVESEGVVTEVAPLVAMMRFAERLVQRWCALLRGPARLAESLALAVDETSQRAARGRAMRAIAGTIALMDATTPLAPYR